MLAVGLAGSLHGAGEPAAATALEVAAARIADGWPGSADDHGPLWGRPTEAEKSG